MLQMDQCRIQVAQPTSKWQHSAVTQAIRFRYLQRAYVRLIKHGVMRPLLAT